MATMKFQRTFKLKPYWQEWFKKAQALKTVTLTENLEIDGIKYGFGGHSVTIPPTALNKFLKEDLSKIYLRDNVTLKIFHLPILMHTQMYECFWGGEACKIVDTTRIQNIMAFNGIAPRVYDLVFLTFGDYKMVAQVTEFVEAETLNEEELNKLIDNIATTAPKYNIYPENVQSFNFVGRKFVDFGRWYADTFYKERLQERAKIALQFGGSEEPYQSVEGIHVKGQRYNLERNKIFEKAFKKDRKLLPDNFTVVDFGCSGGFFLERAFDWGAGYGIGVDIQEVIDVASEISYFLDYFNADFHTELPDRKFDFGFYLSMDRHTDFEAFIPCINKLLYLEGHSGDPREKYIKMLKPHFKKVEYLGSVSDYGERHLFRAVR